MSIESPQMTPDELRKEEEVRDRLRQPSPWIECDTSHTAETAPAAEVSGEALRDAQDLAERLARHGRDYTESR